MKKNDKISWSSTLSFLSIASWLIGMWTLLAGREMFGFPFWHWWVHGVFLAFIALSFKLEEIHSQIKRSKGR